MPKLSIYTVPIGSQLTSRISNNEKAEKNDFPIFITADGNVTLERSDINLSSGYSIQAFEGKGCTYRAMIRPPTTAGVLTVSIAKNAVIEGNPAVSKDIRVSTQFPDADAETYTEFITPRSASFRLNGFGITDNRIYTCSRNRLYEYDFNGTFLQESTISVPPIGLIFNETFFSGNFRYALPKMPDGPLETLGSFKATIAHTAPSRLGYLSRSLKIIPYANAAEVSAVDAVDLAGAEGQSIGVFAMQDDLIFSVVAHLNSLLVSEITQEDTYREIRAINVQLGSRGNPRNPYSISQIGIYQDTLYVRAEHRNSLYKLDIRKYRPLAKNTTSTIHPIFANVGDRIDLMKLVPDAERVIFDVGFSKPSYLSINSNNQLLIAANAVSETTPLFVKLLAINSIDSRPFEFYLVIENPTAPVVRKVDELTLLANSTFDLFQIVKNANSITFRTGKTQPTHSRISDGILTIGTHSGTAYFTATNATGRTNFEIKITVVQAEVEDFPETARDRIELAGINVTPDLQEISGVSESLDAVSLNEYRVNDAVVVLRSANGKYNGGIPENFWEKNRLNTDGYQERIKIFKESLVNGSWVSHVRFSGVISRATESIDGATVSLTCVDISSLLKDRVLSDFGTHSKWGVGHLASDEVSFESEYLPEASMTPIQPKTGRAWHGDTQLTLRQTVLPSEGPPLTDTGHLTDRSLRVSGKPLTQDPLLSFKTHLRAKEIESIASQLGQISETFSEIYQVSIDADTPELQKPYILNRGSVPFAIQKTRITRLPTDWVSDGTNHRILILLSNRSSHIADMLVSYDAIRDTHRILHTFENDVKVHRIARRSRTQYYILTSKDVYDSVAESSQIKIYHYNAATNTLTEHVSENDTYPPQLGIHYFVGFENGLYTNASDGIRPEYRGALKWIGNSLYYRYAKDKEFGVARVNASAMTQRLMWETDLGAWNHLNFAFDVTSGGVVYFVYSVRDSNTTSLVIRRRAADDTVTMVLTETRNHGDFDESDQFGGFLGCYEALFHNNQLLMLCPIQVIKDTSTQQGTVTPTVTIVRRGALRGVGFALKSAYLRSSPLDTGDTIQLTISFNTTAPVISASNLQVRGGTFTTSNNTLSIRPKNPNRHANIIVDILQHTSSGGHILRNARILIDFGVALSRSKTAGMGLYRCNVTAAKPTLTLIDKWDFVSHSACNLTVHNGFVHYTEHPRSATVFKPINPDL